jgi:ABC-2 type transport system ATP-binding protein
VSEIAIKTDHLTRDFETVRAVDHLDLRVETGIIFGLLGPNGSGKTTTIRLLLGLLDPSSGSARILGFDSQNQADQIRQRCGALLEHNGLYERLSAIDNLDFYARVSRMPSREREGRIKELLQHFGLWERRFENVGDWSRGMKQKLAIARTLIHHPDLVFLDEPTAGLDPVSAAALRNDLASLADHEGVTIFLTTHNLSEAEKLCHTVGVIREGKLLASGSLEDLKAKTIHPKIVITGSGFSANLLSKLKNQSNVSNIQQKNRSLTIELTEHTQTAPLVNWMVASGVQIDEVQKRNVNLEDVFLSLVNEEKDHPYVI